MTHSAPGRRPTPGSLRRSAAAVGGSLRRLPGRGGRVVVARVVEPPEHRGDLRVLTTLLCSCGSLEWPAYALAHGHNPFFSTALFHPGGINLLSNTSVLAIGIPLAPVTWIFGPVATLNVASTLGPALSALAMFWLLRRWVRWTPAALVGGLVFGFVAVPGGQPGGAHLMSGVLVFLPLMVACLDELLVRQQRRPLLVGAVLGLLLTAQFFLGTEVLTMVVLTMPPASCCWWPMPRSAAGANWPHEHRTPGAVWPPLRWWRSCSWPTRCGSLSKVRPTCPAWCGPPSPRVRGASSFPTSGTSPT